MAFNRVQTIKAVEAKVTEQNLLVTIKQYRAMGESGIISAIQNMKTVAGEYAVVALLIVLDMRLNGLTNTNSLAERIWMEQGQKIEQYQSGAFRLSEKQLAVIARHFIQCTTSIEFA